MVNLVGRHLISPNDLSLEEISTIVALGQKMKQDRAQYSELCRGKILATLFYEPSTRTKLSFESAMLRMGGSILGFSDASSSSAAKGESIADTIRVLASYADVAVMR
ncbi:MAG TPA: aspartate carbamoyltransferase, partial [Bacillota bacterium]|nr:aspartate carbamoyltransferase [Bacillota bacterium]